jgi:glycosyltransferase involved in cell wall biosynthesis
MQRESLDRDGVTPDALAWPRALDRPDPGRRFSAERMATPLNVLFVVSAPTRSPTISVHADLMRFLNRERVQVHVVYNRLAAAEPYRSSGRSVLDVLPDTPEVRLIPMDFGPVGGPPTKELLACAARAVAPAIRDTAGLTRYIQRNRIDVIHCEEGTRNGFFAFALSRLTRPKCIVHFHSQYGDWMSRPSQFAVKHADAVITVSSWTGQGIRHAGVPAERIFPVLNGVDLAKWNPTGVNGDAVRREFELEAEDPLVVMIAQLVPWKRQETLIKAFRRVADTHPRARLLLVGMEWNPSPVPGAGYGEQLRRLVADTRLDQQVIFAGQRPDVRQVLAAADIFSLPSVGDPCALAHIEAMAMGKPVVGVRAAGAPELVVDGETGLLGPADDSDQLASNLIELIEDPERRRRMGQRGRHRVLECLNAQRMADEVEAVYRLVAAPARGATRS